MDALLLQLKGQNQTMQKASAPSQFSRDYACSSRAFALGISVTNRIKKWGFMNSVLDSICDGGWLSLANQARFHSCALARLCGVSQRQLERYFLLSFGLPPKDWLNEARLCRARRLLLRHEAVKAVTKDLGFAHPSHFIREFQRFFGCTPLQLVKAVQARGAQEQAGETGSTSEENQLELMEGKNLFLLFTVHRHRCMHVPSPPTIGRGDCDWCKLQYPHLYDCCHRDHVQIR